MTPPNELYRSARFRVAQAGLVAIVLAMYLGGAAAALGWEPGIVLAVAAATALFLVHLGIGIAGYRQAMAREWPAVEPLDDEDDW